MALVLGTWRNTRKAVTGVLSNAGCISMWVCGFLKDASHQSMSQGRMCRITAQREARTDLGLLLSERSALVLSIVQAVVLRGRGCCWLSTDRGDVRRMNHVSVLLDEADGPLCVQKSLPKLTGLRVNLGDDRKGSREVSH